MLAVLRRNGASRCSSPSTTQFVSTFRILQRPLVLETTAPRRRLVPTPRTLSSSTRRTNKASEDGAAESQDEKKEQKATAAAGSQSGGQRSLMREQTLDWEDKMQDYGGIEKFADLPYPEFGYNQHMLINAEFKRALSDIIRTFQAPIIYAFAYGSGVFPQTKGEGRTPSDELVRSVHPKPDPAIVRAQGETPKMIDFIFGVSHTQHFHSLNIRQNRHHYSGLASLGSGLVSTVQDRYGAGVYFNPYAVVNGVLIKYGVVNIATICKDLTEWDTLYLAGRLHKPVKIIRDNARVRLANQTNLLAAVRTALLMLPETFTERELYATIAGLSYLGDPRMALPAEDPRKVANIVGNNAIHFRRLYAPLVHVLPNVEYDRDPTRAAPDADLVMRQAMTDPTRGNMVRRLPVSFRSRLYTRYQRKWQLSRPEFERASENLRSEAGGVAPTGRQGGDFDRAIARDDLASRGEIMRAVIKQTIGWPSTAQSLKGIFMSGFSRSLRYVSEKMAKYRQGKRAKAAASAAALPEAEDEKKLIDDGSEAVKDDGASSSGSDSSQSSTPRERKSDDTQRPPSPPPPSQKSS